MLGQHIYALMNQIKMLTPVVLAFTLVASEVHALQSEWTDLPNARARLLADGDPMTGQLTVGLEIELDKGWKTYWRTPGDSGIPLTLDWSAAQNVETKDLLFPTPIRFADAYGESIGYKDHVVFPIKLTLTNKGHGSKVAFEAFLGICREVCIPVRQAFSLSVPPLLFASGETKDLLGSALENTARPLPPQDQPVLVSLAPSADGATPARLTAQLPNHLHGQVDDVLIEGPSHWFLELPRGQITSGSPTYWALSLNGVPRSEEPWGAPIRLTMIRDGKSYEANFTIPPPNK